MATKLSEIGNLFNYDAHSGEVTWKESTANKKRLAGAVAGTLTKDGYRAVKVLGSKHYCHRLAWLLHYGAVPSGLVDHVDGNRLNNAIANLRIATNAENQQNRRTAKRGAKSTLLGVSFQKKTGKFEASLKVDGRMLHLGTFETEEAAHQAYVDRKRAEHPFCSI